MRQLVLLAVGLLCCGPGTVGEALRPEEPTAAEALGEALTCTSVSDRPEPFLVDWKPEDRGKLQRAMKRGVAVLRYDCKGITVLVDCELPGEYMFAQIAKEGPHRVRLDKNSDLAATIPASALSISGEVRRGMTLDLAYMMVGSRATMRSGVQRRELSGSCAGATHYVRAVWLGAFKLGTATEGRAAASVDVMGAGAKASDASTRKIDNQAGDIAACDKDAAEKFVDGPPPACEAPVRVELIALGGTPSETGPADAPADPGPANNPCGEGFVLGAKKVCIKKDGAGAHLCEPGDRADCEKQCDLGSAESCFNAGVARRRSKGDPDAEAGRAAAAVFHEKGCNGGYAESCHALAVFHANDAAGDGAKAKALFKKACDAGVADSCWFVARNYRDGNLEPDEGFTPDLLQYALYVRQSCNLGTGMACDELADAYIEGVGIARDPAEGLAVLSRSCTAGDTSNCHELAEHYLSGDIVGRDPVKAEQLLLQACTEMNKWFASCAALGVLYRSGDGAVAKSLEKARQYLEYACHGPNEVACTALAQMYQHGEGVEQDERKAVQLYERICKPDDDSGNATCQDLAALLDSGGKVVGKDPARAARLYLRVCEDHAGSVRSCQRALQIFTQLKDKDGSGRAAHEGCRIHDDKKLCAAAKKLPKPPEP